MNLIHKNEMTGFWIATSEEVAVYLGYPAGHFGNGYIAGRWSGAATQLGTFLTVDAAIAAESSVPDRTVERGSPSNALGQHTTNLQNDD